MTYVPLKRLLVPLSISKMLNNKYSTASLQNSVNICPFQIDELQTSLDEAGEERRLLEGQMATAVSKSQKDKDQDARDKSDRLLRVQELEETLRDKKLELEVLSVIFILTATESC